MAEKYALCNDPNHIALHRSTGPHKEQYPNIQSL